MQAPDSATPLAKERPGEQYNYNRQAAFYADVLQAERFLIIGVQKKAPNEICLVEFSTAADIMTQGRKKYQRLLRACV